MFKVEPLLKHALKVSQEAFILGRDLSLDEQTIAFQGRHKDKQRINYKKEGDGFQADTICSDGYTFSFYFRNQPHPKKYEKDGLSPLHCRCMAMIEQLPAQYYSMGMDNLFSSVKFTRSAFQVKQHVMTHGVVRPKNRGVPEIVMQNEVTRKAELQEARNTLKVARLVGAEEGLDIVIASVYDSKPVYILSNCCEEVKWIVKEKEVYSQQLDRKVQIKFYRLNLIDFYNNNMGSVDVADQLRTNYRIDHWLRNRKWWWSIFWWAFQMLMTNSYLCYCSFMKMHRKKPVSHRDFIVDIALNWLGCKTKTPAALASSPPSCLQDAIEAEGPIVESTGRKRKRATLSPSALKVDGALSHRLRISAKHPHLPAVDYDITKPYCQLCMHRQKAKNFKQPLFCPDCNVNLCIICYKEFHQSTDLDKF